MKPNAQACSIREAAELLNVSPDTVRNAVFRGELPSFRVGRRVLVPRAALDRLLQARPRKEPCHG